MKTQKCSVKSFCSKISSFEFGNAFRVPYFCYCHLGVLFQFSSHGSTRLKLQLWFRTIIKLKALCVFLNDKVFFKMNQHFSKESQHFMETFFFLVEKKVLLLKPDTAIHFMEGWKKEIFCFHSRYFNVSLWLRQIHSYQVKLCFFGCSVSCSLLDQTIVVLHLTMSRGLFLNFCFHCFPLTCIVNGNRPEPVQQLLPSHLACFLPRVL